MKDSLFELLIRFFAKSLSQLKHSHISCDISEIIEDETGNHNNIEERNLFLKNAKNTSMRVFTYDEQIKLTKSSYQFLMQLINLNIIRQESMEHIVSQLLASDSHIVTLEETKWVIRNTLANELNANQLAFLDLILYQKEEQISLH